MTEIEKDLNLMLLKLCEELLPNTKVSEDLKIKTAMKKGAPVSRGRSFSNRSRKMIQPASIPYEIAVYQVHLRNHHQDGSPKIEE